MILSLVAIALLFAEEPSPEKLAKARADLASAQVSVRKKAIESLIHSDLSAHLFPEMAAVLKDADGEVRSIAATAVGNLGVRAEPEIPALIAQLGVADMRLPIQYAFSYPDRWPALVPTLDLARVGRLDFDAPDMAAFPCLGLAYRALDAERSLPVVLNAANEVAVAMFLDGRIGFAAIPEIIERAMRMHQPAPVATLAEVRAVDRSARAHAQELARELELKV